MSDKLYCYLFNYAFGNGNGSIWVGLPSQKITMSTLDEVKKVSEKSLPLGTNVVVTGATYLGCMTKEEFMDEASH